MGLNIVVGLVRLNMVLTWFGHSCFRLEEKELSLLIDPFSKEIGLRPPKIKDQVVLITHHHPDHDSIEGLPADSLVIDGPGEYEAHGAYIHGITSYHDAVNGAERGLNTIYLIKLGGISLCHLGDLGQEQLTDEQLDLIGSPDVLLVPVGGKYTIDYKVAVAVVGKIEPKIIIPMHYRLPDLKIELDSADKFLKEIGLTPEKVDKLKLSEKTLPTDEIKLVMFNL